VTYSSTIKMEATRFSETLVDFQPCTRRYISKVRTILTAVRILNFWKKISGHKNNYICTMTKNYFQWNLKIFSMNIKWHYIKFKIFKLYEKQKKVRGPLIKVFPIS
jgi:hypothetical protein